MTLQRVAQGKVYTEQLATFRHDTERSIQEERDVRVRDSVDLRSALSAAQAMVRDCQAGLAAQAAQAAQFMGHHERAALEEIAREVEAERRTRCARDAEAHALMRREVASLATRFEELRGSLVEETAGLARRMQDYGARLEGSITREHSERLRESTELRAILDSVWQHSAGAEKQPEQSSEASSKYFFKFEGEQGGDDRYKAFVGDQEDINTLYEMVREALGDSVHLRQQIYEEKDMRLKEQQKIERLERQVNTVQALLRDATPSAAHAQGSGAGAAPSAAPPRVALAAVEDAEVSDVVSLKGMRDDAGQLAN